MMPLNSQVRKFGGFAHGRRVLCRAPIIPIGAVSNPNFADFANPKDARRAKTHRLPCIIRQIRQASPTAYFNGKLNLRVIDVFRQSRNGGVSCAELRGLATNRKEKGWKRPMGTWVIIGRFVGEFDLVHFRGWGGSIYGVDLEDMRSANRLLEAIGCDVALQLHLPIARSPIRYLVEAQTLIFLSKMMNGISNRNKTKWSIAGARLTPEEFYEPGINREISIRELGRGRID